MDPVVQFYAGLGLAVLSALLIGSGFIFKKRALLRSGVHSTRAGDGGLLYLRDWMWWVGLSLFALGEGANFIAYAFAPASLVTPLGALSVLTCAVLGTHFLNEQMNVASKLGCFICLLGSTLVVLHAPKEQSVNSLREMQAKFFDKVFVAYGVVIFLLVCLLVFVFGPRQGRKNPLVYILISASLGSISVMACKGLGIGIKDALIYGPLVTLHSWFFWFITGLLIVGIIIQLYFLNRALDLFNTGLVTAQLYVFFTGFVLIASAVLFQEWSHLSSTDYVELSFGLILITMGVFMMTVLKDVKIEWNFVTALDDSDRNSLRTSCHRMYKRRDSRPRPSGAKKETRNPASTTSESHSPSTDTEDDHSANSSLRFLLSFDEQTEVFNRV